MKAEMGSVTLEGAGQAAEHTMISHPLWRVTLRTWHPGGPQSGVPTTVEFSILIGNPGAGLACETPLHCLLPAEGGTDHAGGHLGDPVRAGQCHLLL